MLRARKRVLVLAFCLLFFCVWAPAQTTSALRGSILAEGKPISDAHIQLSSSMLVSGTLETVQSNGGFRFPSLPPGKYTLTAYAPGFGSRTQELVLPLGQVITLNLTLYAETQEQLVVSGDVPIKSSDTAVSENFVIEELQRLPVTHDVNALINYAPGINEDRAYGATGESANAYNLDGVDVSDPGTGEHWMLPHIDWVQEIQVTGLGANAEYGGFTGALYNIVTRSGGDTFSGALSLYYSGGSLVDENVPSDEQELAPATLDRDLDLSVSVGGPLIKSKLWFFASAQRADKREVPLGALHAQETSFERYLFKVTGELGAVSRITALLDYDGKTSDFRGVGRDVLPDAALFQDSPNLSYNLTWDLMTENGLLSTKVSGFTGSDDRLSRFGQSVPGHTDLESGLDSQNNAYTRFQDKSRLSLSSDYSLFLSGLGSENHAIKMGLSLSRARHQEERLRNGGLTYVDDTYPLDVLGDSVDLADYLANPLNYAFSSDQGGEIHLDSVQKSWVAYVQDSIEWNRFTLQAGLRLTSYTAGFKGGDTSVYDERVLDPRIGFSWSAGPKEAFSLKGHYGRYHESMFAYFYDREVSGQAFEGTDYYDYNGDAANPAWDVPAGGSAATLGELDDHIKHPYVDQFLVTLEYDFDGSNLLGMDLIRRQSRKINALVNGNDDYDHLQAGENPFGGSLPFYDLLSLPQYQLTNASGAYRDYDSVVLRYERRHRNGYSLRASVVLSDLEGNAYASDGYVDEWQDLNGQTNAEGDLPGNSKLEFKLNGSVALPFGFELGGYFRFLSGTYWTPSAQIRGLYRNDRQTVYLEQRGSRQLPDRSSLDLKLSRRFHFGPSRSLDAYLDVFNVSNEDTVLEVDERWGTYYYDYQDHPGSSEWVSRSAYEKALRIEAPREFRLGTRLSF